MSLWILINHPNNQIGPTFREMSAKRDELNNRIVDGALNNVLRPDGCNVDS